MRTISFIYDKYLFEIIVLNQTNCSYSLNNDMIYILPSLSLFSDPLLYSHFLSSSDFNTLDNELNNLLLIILHFYFLFFAFILLEMDAAVV